MFTFFEFRFKWACKVRDSLQTGFILEQSASNYRVDWASFHFVWFCRVTPSIYKSNDSPLARVVMLVSFAVLRLLSCWAELLLDARVVRWTARRWTKRAPIWSSKGKYGHTLTSPPILGRWIYQNVIKMRWISKCDKIFGFILFCFARFLSVVLCFVFVSLIYMLGLFLFFPSFELKNRTSS